MRVIISAVNFTEGGPLEILKQSIDSLITHYPNIEVYVLLNNSSIIVHPAAKIIAIPACKKSYAMRLIYEYIIFKKISRKVNPYIWLSLHDVSPRLACRAQAVYMHNPLPFHQFSLMDIWLSPLSFIVSKLYLFAYLFNINSNKYVIVQQSWMRKSLQKYFKNYEKIIVARPSLSQTSMNEYHRNKKCDPAEKLILFYPAFPRFFKNFELIVSAISLLKPEIRSQIQVRFTISGLENRYSKYILKLAKPFPEICFVGKLSPQQVIEQFQLSSAVLFPSRLETWGLPLTEAAAAGKFIIASDLPYARETLFQYANVSFLSPDNPRCWAETITRIVTRGLGHDKPTHSELLNIDEPYCQDWHALWQRLLF